MGYGSISELDHPRIQGNHRPRNDNMTQALVTRQQVFDAADQLKREGKSVTGYGTYRLLNDLGSLGTHYKYLAEWEKLQDANPAATPEQTSLPDALTSITADVNARLSRVMEAEVQSRVGAQAAIFRSEAADANQKFTAVLGDCERLLSDLEEERRNRALDRHDREAAVAECAAMKLQVAEAAIRAQGAELREAEIRRYVDDLQGKFDTLLEVHKAEKDESAQLRREVADLQAKLQHTLADGAVAKQAAADANERASADATKAAAEAKALAAACEEARRETKEQAALAARLAGELGAVRRQADEYLGLIKKRRTGSERTRVSTAKSHAN